jgi:membrane protein
MVRRTIEGAVDDNIPFLASALSFDLLLTAIPFVVLLLGAVGYLVQHQVTAQNIEVIELVERFLPRHARGDADRFSSIERLFAQVVENRARLTLIAVPFFLWFSTRLFGGLRSALNEVFDTEERRPLAIRKLIDVLMVVVTATLFVGNTFLTPLVARLEGRSEWLWHLTVDLLAVLLSVGLFFVVFKLSPARRINWRTALVASVFCALAFEAAKRLFAFYLGNFATLDRLASDANVAAFILFLVWIYYTALVFLMGGEVAETYDLVRRRRVQRVRLG